jgi:hypothetical protein
VAPVSWLFAAQPRARVAALRTVAYLFVPVDVLLTTAWVADHADVPGTLYQPLYVGRLLDLPAPGPVSVRVAMVLLVVAAAVAATGRSPRLLGGAVAVLYAWWMVVAMSYGKVDHDRFAFLVLLAVLPTAGPARPGDRTADEASGWVLRCVQLAVVATYLLAAVAKFRFGGLEWATGATLSRAILRRGSFLADPLLDVPWLLVAMQWGSSRSSCSPRCCWSAAGSPAGSCSSCSPSTSRRSPASGSSSCRIWSRCWPSCRSSEWRPQSPARCAIGPAGPTGAFAGFGCAAAVSIARCSRPAAAAPA